MRLITANLFFHSCVVYGNSMEDEVADDLSGDLKRVMVALMTARRPERTGVDPGRAQRDANELKSAGVDQWGWYISKIEIHKVYISFMSLRNNCIFTLHKGRQRKHLGLILAQNLLKF